MTFRRALAGIFAAVCVTAPVVFAQQMPNPKEISGVPLPAADVAAGAVSVRVVRGAFTNNVANHPVEFTVDGQTRTIKTDDQGRALLSGLKPGTKVRAVTTVDGERLESQDITIGAAGLKVVLVAIDPDAVKRAEEDKKLAEAPAVKGLVVLGPESRIVATMQDDSLQIYYVLDITNSARTPVDIGGPLIFQLPREARGASLLEGSSPQATAKDARVIVTGPFAPGSTMVQVAYELPFSGANVDIVQTWPVALPRFTVLVPHPGGLDIRSAQITQKDTVSDQGEPVLIGEGPAIAAGGTTTVQLMGLPHRAAWPRYVALSLAGVVMFVGIWSAVFVTPRRRT